MTLFCDGAKKIGPNNNIVKIFTELVSGARRLLTRGQCVPQLFNGLDFVVYDIFRVVSVGTQLGVDFVDLFLHILHTIHG
jgi:hypothetical protein